MATQRHIEILSSFVRMYKDGQCTAISMSLEVFDWVQSARPTGSSKRMGPGRETDSLSIAERSRSESAPISSPEDQLNHRRSYRTECCESAAKEKVRTIRHDHLPLERSDVTLSPRTRQWESGLARARIAQTDSFCVWHNSRNDRIPQALSGESPVATDAPAPAGQSVNNTVDSRMKSGAGDHCCPKLWR
ncbi:unnamed protein product [Pleuronectes platessa]|uniref:Uncharacterized protein n=1 Tax=Pleuronectes platessa TaxID=8262 RepID=A0A9N7UN37_PLEPL|nr:unnamed protein product [Pleuronectes platessa]